MATNLGIVDLVLLVASMVASALIGFYFSNKNKSIDAYMLGDRKLSVVPVAVSLMTSCLSGLTLLGSSAELYYQGPSYSFVAVSMVLCGPITAYTILPVFYQMNELSLYKYLQLRYGPLIKYIVTSVFILQMVFYNSVVLYLPSMALQSILGISKLYSILTIGVMCVLYSGIGGLKAVVWTDLFQALLMYAAIVSIGVLGTVDAGGVLQVFRNAHEGGRLRLDGFLELDLTTRHTLAGVLLGGTIKHVYLVGVNQVQIQRALSLPSLKQGQRAFIFCSLFAALVCLLSTYMGLVLYSAYRSCDPFLNGEIPRRDAVIVHYVAHRLKDVPGLQGVFIAGIFSATLSTLSSFANSMAALALEDFVRPLVRRLAHRRLAGPSETWLAKLIAILFGLVCVLMAFVIEKANSRLLQATTTMFGAIGVPFLASFALGIYTRYTNTCGILAGFAVTLTLGAYITLTQVFLNPPLAPQMPIYYDDRCAQVFNLTLSSQTLGHAHPDDFSWLLLAPSDQPFALDRISYMTLPAVQFVLTILVASAVSLLTGGWRQKVDEKYLARIVRSNEEPSDIVNTNCYPTTSATSNCFDLNHSLTDEPDTESQRKRKFGVINRGFQCDDVRPTPGS